MKLKKQLSPKVICFVLVISLCQLQHSKAAITAKFRELDCSKIYEKQVVGTYFENDADLTAYLLGTTIAYSSPEFTPFGKNVKNGCDAVMVKVSHMKNPTATREIQIMEEGFDGHFIQPDQEYTFSKDKFINFKPPASGPQLTIVQTDEAAINRLFDKQKYVITGTVGQAIDIQIEIFVGYDCGTWDNSTGTESPVCYPAGFGPGPGVFQSNRSCIGKVQGFNDTDQTNTEECNSTIDWADWAPWGPCEMIDDDEICGINATKYRKATNCKQSASGGLEEQDVDAYWCGEEIYHIQSCEVFCPG
eukprot:TCONS_00065078-protein